tara:strand:- start:332 stop:1291 length:960 start_codon:yes stop_codon:yes gene_type:complete
MFVFGIATVEAKSISDKKQDQFCLPKDVATGMGCVWQVSNRTKGLDHQIQIVSSEDGHPVRDGKLSLRFEVRPGECWGSFDKKDLANDNQPNNDCERTNGKSERAEMGTKKFYKGKKWYAWSIYIPEGQEFLSPSSLKLFQFDHNDGTGYQQLANFDHGDGKYTFFNAVADWEESKSVDVIGKWTDIVVNANWSHKDNGYYKIWADGKMIYNYQGPTFYAKNLKANIKIGIYRNWLDRIWELGRDGGITVVYYDEIRFGKSEKSLDLDYKLETEIKKSEAELIQDEIAVLTAKVKKNYDAEISKKIKKLKRKLRRLKTN